MKSLKTRSFWVWLGLLGILLLGLLVLHYATQSTPNPVAFTVPLLGLPVYWYGIFVMGALLFATYSVAQMVQGRSERIFERSVSAEIRQKPLSSLDLPASISSQLQQHSISTEGALLWLYGIDPKQLQLSQDDLAIVEERVASLPPAEKAGFAWRSWNPEYVWNGVMWSLIFGVVGARLYHVLTPQPSLGITVADYLSNPSAIFNLRNGGLGIFGALVGGTIGLAIFVWRHKLYFPDWIDLGAMLGALTQAIGRWANYFNQELFGAPTDLPWGLYIDPRFRPNDSADLARYHPTFLYESLWSFATFFLLYWLWRQRKLAPGGVAGVYLICYGFGRILLETVRIDSNTTGGIATASLMSASMIIIGVVVLVWGKLKPGRNNSA